LDEEIGVFNMTERTISQHFERVLIAPLVNVNWSWGSQRSSDGTIFLRCGDNDFKFKNGRYYITVYHHNADNKLGRVERKRHIDMITNGTRAFIVGYTVRFIEGVESIIGYDDAYVWKVESICCAENEDIQAISSAKLRINEIELSSVGQGAVKP
jgi:hypothetical protein